MAERSPELQAILDKIDIVTHIERYETLKLEGNRYMGSHNHSDSKGNRCMAVYPDTQSWFCWHCNDDGNSCDGGSVIDYDLSRLGCGFQEAVESVCQQHGIDHPNLTPEQLEQIQRDRAEREPVQGLMMKAFSLYHQQMAAEQRDYYRNRGLSDETIDENLLGYAPASGRWLVEQLGKECRDKDLLLKMGLFFLNNKDGTLRDRYQDRYVMPYWYQGKIVFSIGRSIDPKIEAHKKYVKHLTYSDKYPYVSQLAVQHILWGEDAIQQGKPILVAEGIIDALLAKQELGTDDYSIISPVTTKISNTQRERIADLTKAKGVSEIIFVNDNELGKAGEKGALATAQKIRNRWTAQAKAKAKATQDSNKDKDGDKGKDDDDPQEWTPHLKIATLPRPPELDKIDLADYLSDGKVEAVKYWIEAARTLNQFKQYLKGNPSRFFFSKSFIPKFMADELRTEGGFYLYTAERLYRYQDGVYGDGEGITARIIQSKLKDRSRDSRINETLKFLNVAESGVKPEMVNPDSGKLNFENGVLDLATGNFESHTPDFYSTVQNPVVYDESAKCPRIDQFFTEVLPPDCLELIEEMFGYCLIQTTRFQRAFMLTGSGANGKSTLLNLLTAFLGTDNVSKVPLQELDENRFKRAELFGKLANVFADLDSRALQSSTYFKTITTGDDIDAERKHRDPFFFKPFCKLIFSANEVPKTNDRTFAYYRRWLIIPFPNKFEGRNDNKNLIDELTTPDEVSGLLNRALDGLKRLVQNQDFSENETTRQALDAYQTENDNVKQFLAEYCEVETGAETVRSELFGKYKSFCEINGYTTASQIAFNRRIHEIFPRVEKTRADDSKRTRIWWNLKLND